MKWFFITFFLFIASASYCQSERWQYIDFNERNYSFYYDTETIKTNSKNNSIDIWVKGYPKKERYDEGRGYLESGVSHFVLYCNTETYKEIDVIYYYKDGTHYIEKYNRKKDIKPETLAEVLYRLFCK